MVEHLTVRTLVCGKVVRMSGKRRKYTGVPGQAARLVIEKAVRSRMWLLRSGVGEQVWSLVRLAKERALVILARCWMLMSAQSWSVCAGETPNYVWTVHFEKSAASSFVIPETQT